MIIVLVVLLVIAIAYSIYCYNSKQPKTVFKKAKVIENDTVQDISNESQPESTLQELRAQL